MEKYKFNRFVQITIEELLLHKCTAAIYATDEGEIRVYNIGAVSRDYKPRPFKYGKKLVAVVRPLKQIITDKKSKPC